MKIYCTPPVEGYPDLAVMYKIAAGVPEDVETIQMLCDIHNSGVIFRMPDDHWLIEAYGVAVSMDLIIDGQLNIELLGGGEDVPVG